MSDYVWLLSGMTAWLMGFTAWDLVQRRIPHWLHALAMLSGGVWLWSIHGHVPWLMMGLGTWIGFGGALLVGLPGGDRLVMAWVGMMVGPWRILIISLVCYSLLLVITWTWGQHHSMMGVPFVPMIAIVTLIVITVV